MIRPGLMILKELQVNSWQEKTGLPPTTYQPVLIKCLTNVDRWPQATSQLHSIRFKFEMLGPVTALTLSLNTANASCHRCRKNTLHRCMRPHPDFQSKWSPGRWEVFWLGVFFKIHFANCTYFSKCLRFAPLGKIQNWILYVWFNCVIHVGEQDVMMSLQSMCC